MFYYKIAGVTLESCYQLPSFKAFTCEQSDADVTLEKTEEHPPKGQDLVSGAIAHRRLADGWFYHSPRTDRRGLFVSSDYTSLRMLGEQHGTVMALQDEWMVRLALECQLACRGYVSLHAAAVEVGQEAYAFSGPSGIGKSTRADAWIRAFNASLISGDRPLIDVSGQMVYGVPWDGKEQCFCNVSFPLKVICEVQRSHTAAVHDMTFSERRNLLMTQCFIPMWDTETALIQMGNIARLARTAQIVRTYSGSTPEDAVRLYELLQQHLDHA